MALNELTTGVRVANDGDVYGAKGGFYGETLTDTFYAEQVARGNGYCFSSALAGVALIAATTTNNKMVLWNPPDSGRIFYLHMTKFGRTAVGTPLEGSIVYNRAQNIRSFGATGNDIVSGTAVAGVNLRSDKGDDSKLMFFPAASVFTTAPALWGASGIAQTADNGATTVGGPQTQWIVDEVRGLLQLFPGTAMCIGAAVSIATTYTISMYGLSLRLPESLR